MLTKIYDLIASLNWKVVEIDFVQKWGEQEEFTNGGICIAAKTIFINTIRSLSLEKKLLVLIHELGHILSYQRGYINDSEKRSEVKAYLYGWAVIRKYGIDISKADWKRFNYIF